LQAVSIDDRILFCRQLATLLTAGVDLLQSLTIITRQIQHPRLKEILAEISSSIEKGSSLSDSFAVYPKIFNPLFINIIRIGEESGGLDTSFQYLGELYENEKSIRERIKMATRYPKIVITALSCAMLFLMSFVVPKFVSVFDNAKVELPIATRILISLSDFFASYFVLIILSAGALAVAYRYALRNRKFVMARDRLALKIPILGDLAVKIYMSRFCRVFSILTSSGINIIKTLKLSTAALENLVLVAMLDDVRNEVEKGTDLYQAMTLHEHFPEMVVQMVTVGEESGKLDEMMGKVADYYEVETDYTIKNLSSLIEPILLLLMGIMVGFIALAIFTPMWDMMNVAKGG
jgi:MSHA biogenesis protein MshG